MNVVQLPSSANDWHDDPLPLEITLEPAAQFPMDAMPPVLANVGKVIQRTTQAPDAMIGASLLAATSLAAQPHADVVLPHGASSPLSLFVLSVAESGERKSAVDSLVLRPHSTFEKSNIDEAMQCIKAWEAKPKKERDSERAPAPPVFLASDPTIEGIAKLLHYGLPSIGIFTSEGGSFIGGHGMTDDAALRTAAGCSKLWDGQPIDRVRGTDGIIKLYGRRVAMHLMAQPRATFNWLSNPVLRDQGLFSRCLVTYPASTAGTRLFKDEQADKTDEYARYFEAMRGLLDLSWQINDNNELRPRVLGIGGSARKLWIAAHDEIERQIPTTLRHVRGFASKAAEQIARIGAGFSILADPQCPSVSHDAIERAASIVQFFIGESIRLSGAQPQHEGTDRTALMWRWLQSKAKREFSLAELCRKGPPNLRKAKIARDTMATLCDHYLARPIADVEFDGKKRSEGWEIRL